MLHIEKLKSGTKLPKSTVLDFSPSHLQWAGHQIDPTWGQRYENPKYTFCRVLCQYCTLKVSKVWTKALLWERCQTWNKCDLTWPRELSHISLTKGHRGSKFSVYLENRNAAVQKNQHHLKRCGMQLRTTIWGCPHPHSCGPGLSVFLKHISQLS